MDYPAAVVEKAKCLESLLQRVEACEPFEPVLAIRWCGRVSP